MTEEGGQRATGAGGEDASGARRRGEGRRVHARVVAGARTVDVHIRHLREKPPIDPKKPAVLFTVRRVGYRFNE